MATEYPVKPGDCISSIAYAFGLAPDTIWKDGQNQALRDLRKNPNTLVAGVDVVHVRDRIERREQAATDKRHRYRRRGVPEELRLRFLDEADRPRVNIPYELKIDGGGTFQGVTDGNGVVRAPILPNAPAAVLILKPANAEEERFDLDLGWLPPPGIENGTAERLRHLGLLVGDAHIDDEEQELQVALMMFQRQQGLPETGKADGATLDALKKFHGS